MTRRLILPLVGAGFATAAIAASSFGLVSTLPQPTRGDRLGVRLLLYLERARGNGSVISVGGETLRARCSRLSPRRDLITLSDGQALVLSGSHIRAWRDPASPLASMRRRAALHAAEADLAGSYRLYAAEVKARLVGGDDLIGGTTIIRGTMAYRVELAHVRPIVELIVERDSLRPLGARFRSARVRGVSSFLGAADNRSLGC